MAWSTPLTAVSNTALTAAQWNASVRDNLLETAAAKATAASQYFVATGANALAARTAASDSITTQETTTSTVYTDMTTVGPTVPVTTGTKALVSVSALVSNTTVGSTTYMSYAISGATTAAAQDTTGIAITSAIANQGIICSNVYIWGTFVAGSNTIQAKYRVGSGTGTINSRRLSVMPF